MSGFAATVTYAPVLLGLVVLPTKVGNAGRGVVR